MKKICFLYVFCCAFPSFQSCGMDQLEVLGQIENYTKKNIIVVWTDKVSITDSMVYNGLFSEFSVKSESNCQITSFGIPKESLKHGWYFHFFDNDTLGKYLYIKDKPNRTSQEAITKAFLRSYKINQEILERRAIHLIFK